MLRIKTMYTPNEKATKQNILRNISAHFHPKIVETIMGACPAAVIRVLRPHQNTYGRLISTVMVSGGRITGRGSLCQGNLSTVTMTIKREHRMRRDRSHCGTRSRVEKDRRPRRWWRMVPGLSTVVRTCDSSTVCAAEAGKSQASVQHGKFKT